MTGIVSGHRAIWVTTKGGHLLAFNPITTDVLLVHQRNSYITAIVCFSEKKLVTFGECVLGEQDVAVFTVWENYIF